LPEADHAESFSAPPPRTADAKPSRSSKLRAGRRQTCGKRHECVAKRSKTVENESEFFRNCPQFSAKKEGISGDNPCIQQPLAQNQAVERDSQNTICQISEHLMPPCHGSAALPEGGQAALRSCVDNSSSPLIMG
jgi:hypothetical protein